MFKQFSVNPNCKLCDTDPETRQHFLVECKSLQHVWHSFCRKIQHVPVTQLNLVLIKKTLKSICWNYMKDNLFLSSPLAGKRDIVVTILVRCMCVSGRLKIKVTGVK